MPVHFDILDAGHIIYYRQEPPWTYDEYALELEKELAHRNSVNHTVHNLMNASLVRKVPIGVLQARSAPIFSHPTGGHLAIVGVNTTVRMFSQTVLQLAKFERAKFFKTEEEGLQYLRDLIRKEQSTP
jgi:hypothetical protein